MSEVATTDWRARLAIVNACGGEEWESLNEAFEEDWKAAYSAAFVEVAMARGWSRENAATWPENIVEDALMDGAPEHEWCPVATAEADVLQIELDYQDE
jgi:hypothetical protein